MNIVLKETSGEIDVRLIASINSWQFLIEHPFSNNTPHQIKWVYNNDTVITFIEDFLLQLNYLFVQGIDSDIIKQQAINGLEIYTEADIYRLNTEIIHSPEACVLIKVAALMASKVFHQGIFELFLRAFSSNSPDVQRAAVFAVNYIPWVEFRETLLRFRDIYPDLSIDIDVIVQANDSHGWL
jgi:hypothetical protein